MGKIPLGAIVPKSVSETEEKLKRQIQSKGSRQTGLVIQSPVAQCFDKSRVWSRRTGCRGYRPLADRPSSEVLFHESGGNRGTIRAAEGAGSVYCCSDDSDFAVEPAVADSRSSADGSRRVQLSVGSGHIRPRQGHEYLAPHVGVLRNDPCQPASELHVEVPSGPGFATGSGGALGTALDRCVAGHDGDVCFRGMDAAGVAPPELGSAWRSSGRSPVRSVQLLD